MIKRTKKNDVNAKGSMMLLCATEAEVTFFQQFRKDCRYANLTVQKATGNTLEKMLKEAGTIRTKGRYTSLWCLFGLDDYSIKVEDIPSYEEVAKKKRVKMLYFSPSFDLYFALFEMTPRKIMSKDELERRCKASFDGYELTSDYFLTKGLNLNFKIYPRLAVADQNARTYNDVTELDTGVKATTLPDFFDDLKTICGKADMSHTRNRF